MKTIPSQPIPGLTRVSVWVWWGGEVVSFDAGHVALVWLTAARVMGEDDWLLVVHVWGLGPWSVRLHLIHQHLHPQPA